MFWMWQVLSAADPLAAGMGSWAAFRLPAHWSHLSSTPAPLVTWAGGLSTPVWWLFPAWFLPVSGILMGFPRAGFPVILLYFLLPSSFVDMNLALRSPKLLVSEPPEILFVAPHSQDVFHWEYRHITVIWKTGWWVCNSHYTLNINVLIN